MKGTRLASGAAILAASAVLTACQGDPLEVDGVLWRQVVLQYKDPLLGAMRNSLGSERDGLVANARWSNGTFGGFRWSEGDPPPQSLASGGLLIWDVEDAPAGVSFSVLIASGPRDAESDRLASDVERSAPYWGPNAVYTCFGIDAVFTERLLSSYEIDEDVQCDDELAASMDGADAVPIAAFAG